jgi:hypothetical protein
MSISATLVHSLNDVSLSHFLMVSLSHSLSLSFLLLLLSPSSLRPHCLHPPPSHTAVDLTDQHIAPREEKTLPDTPLSLEREHRTNVYPRPEKIKLKPVTMLPFRKKRRRHRHRRVPHRADTSSSSSDSESESESDQSDHDADGAHTAQHDYNRFQHLFDIQRFVARRYNVTQPVCVGVSPIMSFRQTRQKVRLPRPSVDKIYFYVRRIFDQARLNPECSIIALIYIERLMNFVDIKLTNENWV